MFTQQSLSAVTTKMKCPVCGSCLRLTVLEPHHDGEHLNDHILLAASAMKFGCMCLTAPYIRHLSSASVAHCGTLVERGRIA
jgi:hypothetical protein